MKLTIRERSQKVAAGVKENVRQTLRAIAATTGMNLSSIVPPMPTSQELLAK